MLKMVFLQPSSLVHQGVTPTALTFFIRFFIKLYKNYQQDE